MFKSVLYILADNLFINKLSVLEIVSQKKVDLRKVPATYSGLPPALKYH